MAVGCAYGDIKPGVELASKRNHPEGWHGVGDNHSGATPPGERTRSGMVSIGEGLRLPSAYHVRMQNDDRSGFDRYNESLSGLRTWKGSVLTDERRSHVMDYEDLGEVEGGD